MNLIEILDTVPLWGIFVIFIVAIQLSTEVGFQIGRRAKQRETRVRKIRTGPGVTASLGLLAFMLAFTFSTVTSRYDERKQLVLEEANAIGTAYLRSDLLPSTESARIKRILGEYIDHRLEMIASLSAKQDFDMARAKELQTQMWEIAVDLAARTPNPVTVLFLQSLNDLIDLHTKRVTVALHHRMPTVFWKVLFALAIFAMIVGGYDSGLIGGRRSPTSLLAVSAAFGVVLLLIVALERPGHRLSVVTQSALLELQQEIRDAKP